MKLDLQRSLRPVLALGTAAMLGFLAGTGSGVSVAAERAELRVIPTNEIPFGARGAARYQALLERLDGEGWRHDHTIAGFVVFRR